MTHTRIPRLQHHSLESLEARIAPAKVIPLAGLDGHNGFTLAAESGASVGRSIAGLGDINGDGFDDIAVFGDAGANYAGFVLFGTRNGLPPKFTPAVLDGSNGFTIVGPSIPPVDQFVLKQFNISSLGDINRDGFDDFAVQFNSQLMVVFGKSNFDARLDRNSLVEGAGFTIEGSAEAGIPFGQIAAGDFNGDGFADLLVPTTRTDSSYLIFGHSSGFAPQINLADLDATNSIKFTNRYSEDPFKALAEFGDINGDGLDDAVLTVANTGYTVFGNRDAIGGTVDLRTLDGQNGFQLRGRGFPSNEARVAGDINGDGFDDVILADRSTTFVVFGRSGSFPANFDPRNLSESDGFVIEGEGNLGVTADGAGDVNGDGFDDLIVGAPDTGELGGGRQPDPYFYDHRGASYVIFGRPDGFGSVVDVELLNGLDGIALKGATKSSSSGANVSAAGDFNGDGFADLLLSNPNEHGKIRNERINGGSASVVFGGLGRVEETIFTDVDGDVVTVKVTKGGLAPLNFNLVPEGDLGGFRLAAMDLTNSAGALNGAVVKITATPGPLGGNGNVDVGYIDATGVNLAKVKVSGDLGRIDVGKTGSPTPELGKLKVESIGGLGTSTQPGVDGASNDSHFFGDVTTLSIEASVTEASLRFGANLGRAKVGGSVIDSLITVLGQHSLTAVRNLGIGFDFLGSQLLVGYDMEANPSQAGISVQKIKVAGYFAESDIAIGAGAGVDGFFGTSDDVLLPGGGSSIARLAKIMINNDRPSANPDDHFGIVAEEIAEIKIDDKVRLKAGPSNDLDGIPLDLNGDVIFREVAAAPVG